MKVDFVKLMQGKLVKYPYDELREEEFWESDQWALEPLIGGRRLQILKSEEGIKISSKDAGKEKFSIPEKIPYIMEELKALNLPNGTLIDSYISNGNFGETIRIVESDLEKSLEHQKQYGQLSLIFIDLIFMKNQPLCEEPLSDRKYELKRLYKDSEHIKLIQFENRNKREFYELMRNKHDYFVFKNLNSPYFFGISYMWKIFRETKTYFVVVLDIVKGNEKTKFANMCGSLKVGQYENGNLVKLSGISNGMNADERLIFIKHKEKYLNKVIEVTAFGINKKRFVNARYCGVRDDKKPIDCIYQKE